MFFPYSAKHHGAEAAVAEGQGIRPGSGRLLVP
jgi:hypothetical protein